MKTSNVKIKFESFNDYNFMLNLSGNPATAMMGLTLLEEELPAEISFHIPEGYHKRIIGVGGKNIQRIMKKYGVYVKFSNAKEFAKLGGYQNNHDNVVARCVSFLLVAISVATPTTHYNWAFAFFVCQNPSQKCREP